MASSYPNNSIIESQSINRSSFFNDNNYNYWRYKIVIYFKSINLNLQNIVVNGYIPSKKNYKEWNENKKKFATLDAKRLNILFGTINEK